MVMERIDCFSKLDQGAVVVTDIICIICSSYISVSVPTIAMDLDNISDIYEFGQNS